MKKKFLIALGSAGIILAAAFFIYTGIYYRAEPSAHDALESDRAVSVAQTEYGWFFDGPSEENAMVFYPGAKVEETAYAPMLHLFAARGMDVFLVKMPFRLAIFGANRASDIMGMYDYEKWYVGGHSLGGAMAGSYAASHPDRLSGVIMFAAYSRKVLDDRLLLIRVNGSEDGVIRMMKVEENKKNYPSRYAEHVIEGGNHAQFGCYGPQKGDGAASISAKEQQAEAVEAVIRECGIETDGVSQNNVIHWRLCYENQAFR